MAKRQQVLKGMEQPSIPEINAAAENYREQRDKRMRLTVKEIAAKAALMEAMAKHKLDIYRDNDATPPLTVTIVEGKTSVKVDEASYPEPEADDDGDGETAPRKIRDRTGTDGE